MTAGFDNLFGYLRHSDYRTLDRVRDIHIVKSFQKVLFRFPIIVVDIIIYPVGKVISVGKDLHEVIVCFPKIIQYCVQFAGSVFLAAALKSIQEICRQSAKIRVLQRRKVLSVLLRDIAILIIQPFFEAALAAVYVRRSIILSASDSLNSPETRSCLKS